MSKKLVSKVAAAVAAGSILLVATSANAATLVTGQSIKGSGSSFAYNGISKCNALYDSNTVTYDSTGSGTGRTNFKDSSATYSFAVSDGLYTAGAEPTNPLDGTGYTMAALFGGPVVFAYGRNVPAGIKLDAPTISAILKGTITKWGDKAIKAQNKQITSSVIWNRLSNRTIKVFYRTGNSGTNENLTNYLAQTLGTGWTKNQAINTGAGQTLAGIGKGTSALVADSVESDPYGFGYFDLSDAKSANVRIALLKNKRGQYIAPTAAAGALFLNAQTLGTSSGSRTDGTMSSLGSAGSGIDFTKSVRNAYQLTIVTYAVAPKASTSDKAKAVEDYLTFVVNSCMPAQASRLGYVALTGALKTNALAQIAGISN